MGFGGPKDRNKRLRSFNEVSSADGVGSSADCSPCLTSSDLSSVRFFKDRVPLAPGQVSASSRWANSDGSIPGSEHSNGGSSTQHNGISHDNELGEGGVLGAAPTRRQRHYPRIAAPSPVNRQHSRSSTQSDTDTKVRKVRRRWRVPRFLSVPRTFFGRSHSESGGRKPQSGGQVEVTVPSAITPSASPPAAQSRAQPGVMGVRQCMSRFFRMSDGRNGRYSAEHMAGHSFNSTTMQQARAAAADIVPEQGIERHWSVDDIHSAAASMRRRGKVRPGKWKLGTRIAKGSYGEVFMGLNETTGELMAVKVISIPGAERDMVELHQEVALMRQLSHPNIVSYLGAEIQDPEGGRDAVLCIFQEWVPGGSVWSLLKRFGSFSETVTRRYTRQILRGLDYLHSNLVVHRDIKGSNILVDDKGVVKLADFGAAQEKTKRPDEPFTMKGTPYFMAPEVLQRQTHGRPVDIWSLGGAVLQMLTCNPPWHSAGVSTPVALLEHMLKHEGQPPPLPEGLSPSLRDFLLMCFNWDASQRPTAARLMTSAFIQEMDVEEQENEAESVAQQQHLSPHLNGQLHINAEAINAGPSPSLLGHKAAKTVPGRFERATNGMSGLQHGYSSHDDVDLDSMRAASMKKRSRSMVDVKVLMQARQKPPQQPISEMVDLQERPPMIRNSSQRRSDGDLRSMRAMAMLAAAHSAELTRAENAPRARPRPRARSACGGEDLSGVDARDRTALAAATVLRKGHSSDSLESQATMPLSAEGGSGTTTPNSLRATRRDPSGLSEEPIPEDGLVNEWPAHAPWAKNGTRSRLSELADQIDHHHRRASGGSSGGGGGARPPLDPMEKRPSLPPEHPLVRPSQIDFTFPSCVRGGQPPPWMCATPQSPVANPFSGRKPRPRPQTTPPAPPPAHPVSLTKLHQQLSLSSAQSTVSSSRPGQGPQERAGNGPTPKSHLTHTVAFGSPAAPRALVPVLEMHGLGANPVSSSPSQNNPGPASSGVGAGQGEDPPAPSHGNSPPLTKEGAEGPRDSISSTLTDGEMASLCAAVEQERLRGLTLNGTFPVMRDSARRKKYVLLSSYHAAQANRVQQGGAD